MYIITILYLLLIHWVADFLFQTEKMATNKYRDNKALLRHTLTYTGVMMLGLTFLLNFSISSIFLFGFITFVVHTIQDYFISKMTHTRFQRLEYNGPNGAFTIIGLDQWVHFVQLFVTYYYLTN